MIKQTFSVVGKHHQLNALLIDLLDLGYSTVNKPEGNIVWFGNNTLAPQSIDNCRKLFVGGKLDINHANKHENQFHLPNDYGFVLDFCKKQLKSNLKVGDWVTYKVEKNNRSPFFGFVGKINRIFSQNNICICDVETINSINHVSQFTTYQCQIDDLKIASKFDLIESFLTKLKIEFNVENDTLFVNDIPVYKNGSWGKVGYNVFDTIVLKI